ncbi:hypothetical protein HGRIS_001659 [Hohenbuehelia grisea]|uniref:DUF5648 domain-containing protein n=1 Tax=Hohenbuehelia grisea TaxID=104357 RepID=A0ABR3JJ30_9AGAR
MKLSIAAIAIALSAIQFAAATDPLAEGATSLEKRADCPVEDEETKYCREIREASMPFLKLNHRRIGTYYTTSPEDAKFNVDIWGFTRVGSVGRVITKCLDGTKPLWWLHKDYNVFTCDEEDARRLVRRRWEYGGVAGYVLKKRVCGSIPLYRRKIRRTGTYILCTDREEHEEAIKDGDEDEGTVGFVLPSSKN